MKTPITFHSLALAGLDAHPVTVRAEVVPTSRPGGLIAIEMRAPSTGFASFDARACAFRVQSALEHTILHTDRSRHVRVTIECAAAPSATVDLAVACAVAHALGAADLSRLAGDVLLGEVSLAGKVYAPRGLACAIRHMSEERPARTLVTSGSSLGEAKALGVPVTVRGFECLPDLFAQRNGTDAAWLPPVERVADPRGNDMLSRLPCGAIASVLMVAAAGEHGVFFAAEQGSAPTAYARALAVVMPTMTDAERLAVACAQSTHGTEYSVDPTRGRPFRAPHYTVSQVGLVGRGDPLSVGELALAHHGVLFMDDAHAWSVGSVSTIRDAHRTGVVTVRDVRIPARFVLVAEAPPCPCGGSKFSPCGCPVSARDELAKKSGPVRRLCDIVLRLPAAPPPHDTAFTITDDEARRIVTIARERAIARQGVPNGRLPDDSPFLAPILAAIDAAHLGIETPDRAAVARLARTIADLDGREEGEPWESWDVILPEDVAILRSGVPTR